MIPRALPVRQIVLFASGLPLLVCGLPPVMASQEPQLLSTEAAGISAVSSPDTAVPALVRYEGELRQEAGKRIPLRFSVYATVSASSALWSESQSIMVGSDGRYSVLLGAASEIGLPQSLFAAGETRWLSVAIGDGPELQRAMLVSVPYAIKAGDAETLAGHPVAELVTQEQLRSALRAQPAAWALAEPKPAPETTTPPISGSGVTNYIPRWTAAATLGSSTLMQTGTGSTARIGINTTAPATTLDVNGSLTARSNVTVGSPTLATASNAVNSPSLLIGASAYNSSSKTAVAQKFALLTVTSANNTSGPSSNLQFWFGAGANAPKATGLSIAPTGIITFAGGQTFPGVAASGGTINATTYDLGGTRFDYGNQSNAFLAYAGDGKQGSGASNLGIGTSSLSTLSSGASNVAAGFATLHNDSSGSSNTAMGAQALEFNTTGSSNTGIGGAALVHNATGSNNTAIGQAAGPDSASTALTGSTAIGANSVVSASNSLVLGQTTSGSPGKSYVNVGVGTAAPVSMLELSKNAEDGMGPVLTLTNGGGTSGAPGYHPATTAIDFKTYLHTSTAHSPTARIEAIDDDYGNELSIFTKTFGSDSAALIDWVDIGPQQAMYVNGFLNVCCEDGVDPPVIADIGGSLEVDGDINGSAQTVRADDPLDPANKYLTQSSVVSSENMNLYSGNVTTDDLGLATVKLPGWFEAENTDFRYQLTTIGRDAHAWVAEEVANHQFKIATDATFVKVSWQITAVRKDAYAKAHPLTAETFKPASKRGYYLHPELYGQPMDKQERWAGHPRELAKRKAALHAEARLNQEPR